MDTYNGFGPLMFMITNSVYWGRVEQFSVHYKFLEPTHYKFISNFRTQLDPMKIIFCKINTNIFSFVLNYVLHSKLFKKQLTTNKNNNIPVAYPIISARTGTVLIVSYIYPPNSNYVRFKNLYGSFFPRTIPDLEPARFDIMSYLRRTY